MIHHVPLQEGNDPLMYTITRKSSSRRQSANSTDSCYDNVYTGMSTGVGSGGSTGSHKQGQRLVIATVNNKRNFSSSQLEREYLVDEPATSKACSRDSVVASWLNHSSDYLTSPPSSPWSAWPLDTDHDDGRHLKTFDGQSGRYSPSSLPSGLSSASSIYSSSSLSSSSSETQRMSSKVDDSKNNDKKSIIQSQQKQQQCTCIAIDCENSHLTNDSKNDQSDQFSFLYLLASAAVTQLEQRQAMSTSSFSCSSSSSSSLPINNSNDTKYNDNNKINK